MTCSELIRENQDSAEMVGEKERGGLHVEAGTECIMVINSFVVTELPFALIVVSSSLTAAHRSV